MKIELNNLSQIILSGIFDKEFDKQIRVDILGNVPEKHYEMACGIFHEARELYFDLGFIDNSYTEEKDIQARVDIVENIHYKHHEIASKVFDLTREAYYDLGFELRRLLRGY